MFKTKILEFVKSHRLLLTLFFLLLILSTFFRSHYLYNWDAGQFALGTKRFSLAEHQPHPPGYFLFVKLAKILNYVLNDVNVAFLLINFIASLLAILFLFKTVEILSGKKIIAFWLCLLFLVNPVFWFYRVVALTYIFEVLTVVILIYFTVLILKKKKTVLPYAVLAVAIIAGFRQSIVIIALPFLIWLFWLSKNKPQILLWSFLSGLGGFLIWLPWFAHAVGGFDELAFFIKRQLDVAENTQVYNINHHKWLLLSFFYVCHLPLTLLIIFCKKTWIFIKEKKLLLVLLIIVWQIGVYWFLHFGDVGYILCLLPMSYILIVPVIEFFNINIKRKLMIVTLALSQVMLFFTGAPFIDQHKIRQIVYSDIKKHDTRIGNYIEYVKKNVTPQTLVIALRGQFLNARNEVVSYPYDDIRVLGYYLPQIKIYDLLGVSHLYNIAWNYHYNIVNSSEVVVPADTQKIIFLADYIHSTFLPKNIKFDSLYPEQNVNNIYFAEFGNEINFEYNGIRFIKEK